ncbi:MAG: lysophospholipid acyltransferase family protein [Paracoccaceae bacterium]
MTTWDETAPTTLPPLSWPARVRGAVRLVAMLGATGVALGLFLIGRTLRRSLGRWVGFHFAVARLWARLGLVLFGLRLQVRGRPIARGALVANHCSWLDIFALRAVRLIYFVSKADVADWAGVGFVAKVTGTVFIERRRSHAKRQEEVLLERIAADQVLAFFPEGTSTDGLRVLPFKSSLFSAFFHEDHAEDVMIQPVSIRYRPDPGTGLPENFYGWWGSMGFGAHIWQVLCRSNGTADLTFHAPVRPPDFANRKALAEHCQRMVAEGCS